MILKWKFKLEMENNDGFLETPQVKLKVFEMVLEWKYTPNTSKINAKAGLNPAVELPRSTLGLSW